MTSSYEPAPVSPPVSEDYIAGLLDMSLKVDILNSSIRVSIASHHLDTINVVRSFFKTEREVATFVPDKGIKVTIFLKGDEQRRALNIAKTRGLVPAVATAALGLMDALEAHKDNLEAAEVGTAKAVLKKAIADSKKGEPSSEDLLAAPVVSADYAAGIVDQRLTAVLPKPVAAKRRAVDEAEEAQGETGGDAAAEEPAADADEGASKKKQKKTSKKRKLVEPKPRFGKLQINLTKPQGVIAEALRKSFGGTSKVSAQHRVSVSRENGTRWLEAVLPESHIASSHFNAIRVPVQPESSA